MALRTALTEEFEIDHPIVLAPMGGVAGGALAAGVSEGGGLGLIGAGRGDLEWLDRECGLARAATSKPWGIGFLTWAIGPQAVDAAIERSPAAI
ncbi:MAG TPA: nitronate monooxygenase, partial [Mycobacterium sp.]|nr:nitronate monooxygenase [Mycobacterium sp.]